MKVILITLDCGRADHFDGTTGLTPELDAFRQEGTTFTQAFSQSQNTVSSHLSILTSNYLFQHGVYSNQVVVPLPPHSLPRRLEEAGWAVESFTSVEFLASALGDQIGGVDRRFRGLWSAARRHLPGPFGRDASRVRATDTFEAGLRWMKSQKRDRDLFLWLHLFDAHMVYSAPRRFLKRELPPGTATSSCRRQLREQGWSHADHDVFDENRPLDYFPARYRAAVRYLDACLGRFVGELEARGWWDELFLVITADHGECLLGDHGLYCMHQKLFDTTTHVPLWIRFPRGAWGGSTVDALVEHVDIAPTIAAAVGFHEPLYMGHDLAAVAAGDDPGRDFVFSEHVHDLLRAVRDRRFIAIESVPDTSYRPAFPLETERLFRRDGTPASPEHAAAGDRLHSAARDLMGSRPEVRQAWQGREDVDLHIAEQLRRLGYS